MLPVSVDFSPSENGFNNFARGGKAKMLRELKTLRFSRDVSFCGDRNENVVSIADSNTRANWNR